MNADSFLHFGEKMKQKIIDILISSKQDYEKEYDNFPYKADIAAVFEHECAYYLEPICKKVVPLLFKQLKDNPEEKIEDYFPYINSKYRQAVKKDVENFEKSEELVIKKISKDLLENFLKNLMKYSKSSEDEKNQFLSKTFKEIAPSFNILIDKNPMLCLTTCVELRNPKIQNMIINNLSTEITDKLKNFITSYSTEDFKKFLLPLFCYPQDIGVQDYYKKWIARDALHVKLSKPILGHHYENTKTILKTLEKEKLRVQKKQKRRAERKKVIESE